jgi:hypothetical protein
MFFAWDERLEREVMRANRQYFRDKYQLSERDVTAVRAVVGLLRGAGLELRTVRTVLVERVSPLSALDEEYFVRTYFTGDWGQRVRRYLPEDDWQELQQLCDPTSSRYCLRRPDFHHVQPLTIAVACVD